MAPKTSTFFDLKTCLGKSYSQSIVGQQLEIRNCSAFSGENPRIFHDFQKSLGCFRFQARRMKFSFGDRVTRKDVRSFLCNLEIRFFGGRPSWKATGLQLQSRNLNLFKWQAQLENDNWIRGVCYADTLQVWFPAHWVLVRQLQRKKDGQQSCQSLMGGSD